MIKIPSVEECLKLMEEYDMPSNIKNHSLKVREISVFLAEELNKKDKSLDVSLIEASALLHDIAKIHCVGTNKRHDKEGAYILKSLGYYRIADIVEQHVNLWKIYENIVEDEVVNYSDKRVMHDKLVNLPERFEDVKKRYSSELDKICITEKNVYSLEKKIFKNL
ncbi:MAG: HD domain-containing protein, partial [Nanoarchaeota archaeon]|nr:HD domain-containing protein [Nanoarchaeota archaeon]